MKILVIADEESQKIWDFFRKEDYADIDLVISCGDLKADYLSFIATMIAVPVLYVHGNHDDKYERKPPEGCICIEDTVYMFHGIRILGLGGSYRYKPGVNQYTEVQMERRIRRLFWKIRRKGGIDILVTHAPAGGMHDGEDLCHKGFDAFYRVINKYHPKYMLHGHVHPEYGNFKREREHPSGTKIINVCGKYVLHVGKDEHPAEGRTGSLLYDLYKNVAMAGGKRRSHAVYTEEE